MMRDATALADGQLRRPDVHAAIQLHRVGVHDLHAHPGAEPRGDVERQLGLAGARRSDNRQRSHGCQTPAKYPTPCGAPR